MPKHPRKGVAGKKTGATTRKAIRSAQKRGCSLKKIGKASGRSGSTISGISSGAIKNPPKNLAKMIRGAKCSK